MTPIEKKIKNNKQLFEEKFIGNKKSSETVSNKSKIEFRLGWDSGWSNGRTFRTTIRKSEDTLHSKK